MREYPKPFANSDEAYRYTVARILDQGDDRGDRTGTGTRSIFNHNIEIDLSGGTLPIVSLKKTGYRDAIAELIWMLSGSNSLVPLIEQGIHIWTDWPLKAFNTETNENIGRDEFEARVLGDPAFAQKWGSIYPCYGTEMRHFQSADGKTIDQMSALISELKANPNSRRLVWSLWRPEFISIKGGTGLPPCHYAGTLRVRGDHIDAKVKIRSNDVGLGTPYNWGQYGYFLHLVAAIAGYKPGILVVDVDDCHLYNNHIEKIKMVLERESRPDPAIQWTRKPASFDDALSLNDFEVVGYDPQPFIRLPVAV
jgi:thymidylate synthase